MEIAVWVTQLLIMSALIAVIGVAGAPPRDGRESPPVREELDDFIYRTRKFLASLRNWITRLRSRDRKRPPRR